MSIDPPIHDPLSFIRTLQNTIVGSKKYESGFPIIKELLQNAEDSDATYFDYGYLSGVPKANHSLLRCPGIFAVSNGKFTIQNARKISIAIGGSSKPSDENSIGKFGQGMKSIFNLCEAFFYLSDKKEYIDPYDNVKYLGFNFFNPWSVQGKDSYHDNWNLQQRDQLENEVRDYFFHLILKRPEYKDIDWLLLWIPLRIREHSPNKNKDRDGNLLTCITDEYFKEKPLFLNSSETQNEIMSILPMLSKLTFIRYWEGNTSNPSFEIEVQASRRTKTLQNVSENPHFWNGKVVNGKIESPFCGLEVLVKSAPDLEDLKKDSRIQRFGNLQSHIAVTLSRKESQNPKFILRPAVFLPIGHLNMIEESLDSKYEYCLTVHGNFIPNNTRTGIEGLQTETEKEKWKIVNNSQDSHIKWNQILYENALSLIVKIIDQFNRLEDLGKDTNEINKICKIIIDSTFFQHNKRFILKFQSWVCKIKLENQLCYWSLFDNNNGHSFLELPFFENAIIDSFEALNQLDKIHILVDGSKFNLIDKNKAVEWDSSRIKQILDTIQTDKFITSNRSVDWMVLLLDKKDINSDCKNALIKQLKKCFGALCQVPKHPIINKLFELVRYLECSQWIDVKTTESIPFDKIYLDDGISVLVLPQEIVPQELQKNHKNILNNKDAELILRKLVTSYPPEQAFAFSTAINIIEMVKSTGDKSALISSIQDLPFIKVHKISSDNNSVAVEEKDLYISLSDLKLYRYAYQRPEHTRLVEKLLKATKDLTIIFLDKKVNESLNLHKEVFEKKHCYQILSKLQQLNDPDSRQELLEELIK